MIVADIFEDSVEIDNRLWMGSPCAMYSLLCLVFGRRPSMD